MRRVSRRSSGCLLVALLISLLPGAACWSGAPLVNDPSSIGPDGRVEESGEEGYVAKWDLSSLPNGAIEYWVNPSFPAGVAPFASEQVLVDSVQRAFQAWEDIPTCEIRFTYMGTTDRTNTFDGKNVVTFDPEFYFSPEFPGGIFPVGSYASEAGSVELPNGEVIAAAFPCQALDLDLVINPRGTFSLSDDPFLPELHDLVGILVHEIGHGLGLDHTGICQATMYGYSTVGGGRWNRELSEDEVASVSALYPASSFRSQYGSITGAVRNHLGHAVFGAHVVAIDAGTGCAVASTITGLLEQGTDGFPSKYGTSSGDFLLHVPDGEYLLLVEPFEPTGQGSAWFSGVLRGDETVTVNSDFVPLLGSSVIPVAGGERVAVSEVRVAKRTASTPAFDRRAAYAWSDEEAAWVDPIRVPVPAKTRDITMLVLHGAGIASAGRITPEAGFRFLNDAVSVTDVSVYNDAYLSLSISVSSDTSLGLHVLEVWTPDGAAYYPGFLRVISE
jgi:hypothetical protein